MLLNLLACVYQYAKFDIPHVFAHLTFLSRNYLSAVHLCHIKVETEDSRTRAHQMDELIFLGCLFNVFVCSTTFLVRKIFDLCFKMLPLLE